MYRSHSSIDVHGCHGLWAGHRSWTMRWCFVLSCDKKITLHKNFSNRMAHFLPFTSPRCNGRLQWHIVYRGRSTAKDHRQKSSHHQVTARLKEKKYYSWLKLIKYNTTITNYNEWDGLLVKIFPSSLLILSWMGRYSEMRVRWWKNGRTMRRKE